MMAEVSQGQQRESHWAANEGHREELSKMATIQRSPFKDEL